MAKILLLLSILSLNMPSGLIIVQHEQGQVLSFCHEPQFTITVPGMHSVSEMYETLRAVCPTPTKQSSLVLLRKLIIGLSNKLT